MRFNREVSGERHQVIAEALGRPGGDAADMIERLIADLGVEAMKVVHPRMG
jgi:hypothetical protein